MLLEGKRIIITGGATGCGAATVLACAREGASVVSISRRPPTDEKAVKVVADALKLGPGPVKHVQLDVSNQDNVNRVFKEIVGELGGLDGLVNSHGIEKQGPAENVTAADLTELFAVHSMGMAFTCIAAFPYMKEKGGSIVNLSSYAGIEGMYNMSAYSASKGAIAGYSRSIAQDWGKYMIRVNILCPGAMTELAMQAFNEMSLEEQEKFMAWIASHTTMGTWVPQVDDVANVNVFLLSDMSKCIHGQTIGADGGAFFSR